MPNISIIVPIYQAEDFVERCVQSVVNQTFQDWELLLIDDGSRDNSGAICKDLAEKDSRIRYFHKKNGGVSTARNYGLREATGDTIAFLDADDLYHPAYLETLWNLRAQEGMDSAGCAHFNWYGGDNRQSEALLPAGTYEAAAIREAIVLPLLGERLRQPVFNGFIWRFLFDATILRNENITFEGAYLEDELFLLEYFSYAKGLAVSEAPLYDYYYNPNSATHKYMPKFLKVYARFMERKGAMAEKFDLEAACPTWRDNTNWAGLLIAIGNEYAAGNPASVKERQQKVKTLCQRPDMAHAIANLAPEGLSQNKQLVVRLVRGKHYFMLTLMYRLKNRI
ncbi:glycosyltransferase [Bengtsoniella intestinalis]|uniref:glycosyltransferase family 2 protein n=1 Tax=Bengtsoniella intestinalis TaxID=3073143 RepID=UPI00391F6B25